MPSPFCAELAALAFDEAVEDIDRLRAVALLVPPEVIKIHDLRPLRRGDQDDEIRPHADPDPAKRVARRILQRLNGMGITTYEEIANWTNSDIDRVSQALEFKGRIERDGWVEQARILSSGGYTEFSRRVDRGEVDTSRET